MAGSVPAGRTAPVKFAFNVASIGCATAVAALIVASHPPLIATAAARRWLVLVGAVIVGLLITSASTFGVIWLVQGPMTSSRSGAGGRTGLVDRRGQRGHRARRALVIQTPWAFVLLTVVAFALATGLSRIRAVRAAASPTDRDLRPHSRDLRDVLRRNAHRHPAATRSRVAARRVRDAVAAGRGPLSGDAAFRARRRRRACSISRPPRRACGNWRSTEAIDGRRRSEARRRRHAPGTAGIQHQGRDRRPAALRRGRDRHARSRRPDARHSSTSRPTTSGCWRRSRRTRRSRWRTIAWSTGCGSTPTTTR